jgi:hypothetical protein
VQYRIKTWRTPKDKFLSQIGRMQKNSKKSPTV